MDPLLEKRIKLIWDFRGPGAAKMAEHYQKHLDEFILIEELKFDTTGFKHLSNSHSITYLVVAEFEMPMVRDILKPHRGEFYEDEL